MLKGVGPAASRAAFDSDASALFSRARSGICRVASVRHPRAIDGLPIDSPVEVLSEKRLVIRANVHRDLRTRVEIQPTQDRCDVFLDRLCRQIQLLRDDFVGPPLYQQRKHIDESATQLQRCQLALCLILGET
jgi:hypothetical protein